MNQQQFDWLTTTAGEAAKSSHIFPEMAACEAALESGKEINGVMVYGGSELAVQARNLFGMKQHQHPIYGTLNLPTKEFLNSEWVSVEAHWIVYPDLLSCFTDRMTTLQRLAPHYDNYARALMAPTPQMYVVSVSKTWSTDPERGDKVLSIYNTYLAMKEQGATAPAAPVSNSEDVQEAAAGDN